MKPDFPKDFSDFLACLVEEGVEFMIVGAHAMAAWGKESELPRDGNLPETL